MTSRIKPVALESRVKAATEKRFLYMNRSGRPIWPRCCESPSKSKQPLRGRSEAPSPTPIDGCVDPAEYLARLARETGSTWRETWHYCGKFYTINLNLS